MTVQEILSDVSRVKPISRETLYTYLRVCEIKPVSDIRQRPQQYPEDAPKRILIRLGFNIAPATPARKSTPKRSTKLPKGRHTR